MGNIRSVAKAFELTGAKVEVTYNLKKLRNANALVLPGVGAFEAGMKNLRKLKLIPVIKEAVKAGKPFLGICLGMQLLFSESEEHGLHKGLDIIPGRVVRFKSNLKIPHMGWNTIIKTKNQKLKTKNNILQGVKDGAYFYFVHSYYVKPKKRSVILATSEYGQKFTCVIGRGNTFGIQFHPEKSSDLGIKILKKFCKIAGEAK